MDYNSKAFIGTPNSSLEGAMKKRKKCTPLCVTLSLEMPFQQHNFLYLYFGLLQFLAKNHVKGFEVTVCGPFTRWKVL